MQTMLTVKELSRWLNIKPSTLYLWVSQGKIPFRRLNRLIRFETPAIQAWLDGSPQPHPPVSIGWRGPLQSVDAIIEAAKREVYSRQNKERKPKSGPIGKDAQDGAHKA